MLGYFSRTAFALSIMVGLVGVGSCGFAQDPEYLTGIEWPEPPIVTPAKDCGDPPSDAVVLFDGKDLSAWENGDNWKVKEGVAIVGGGDITSKQSFGDCQLHIEWSAPVPPTGESQGRGNSGVYLMDRYELQVLDSYENKTYFDGQASAIYKQTPPMVNAMRPPGEWNTYDIIFTAPRFKEDGSLKSHAYITVLHNGVLTLNHFKILGNTPFNSPPKYEKHGKLPIHLQDHGNPVRYRNIWVREFKPIKGKRGREPYFHDHVTGKEWSVEKSDSIVRGKITVGGETLKNARIVLRSDDAQSRFRGDVKDGTFQINNVKPGQYTVSVRPADASDDEPKIPMKFRKASQSGLSIEVKDGENEFDFELSQD
jgi:hypothetical protein